MNSEKTMRYPLLALSCLAFASLADEHEAAITAGGELYETYQCWQCHGYQGQGGAAQRLASVQYSYEAFTMFVRYPNLMPAYPQEQLGDDDLKKIFDYLRSIPEPPPRDAIPALEDG